MKRIFLLLCLSTFVTACSQQLAEEESPYAQSDMSSIEPLTEQGKIDYALSYAELGGLIEKVDLASDGSLAGQKMANCVMISDASVDNDPLAPANDQWYEMRLADKSATEICPLAFSFRVTLRSDGILAKHSEHELHIEVIDPELRELHDVYKEDCTGSGSFSAVGQTLERSINLDCSVESLKLGTIGRKIEFALQSDFSGGIGQPTSAATLKITTTIKSEVYVDSLTTEIDGATGTITKSESLSGLFPSWPDYDVHSFLKYLFD